MSKPILIFDGDCGFCRRWIERWRGITGDRIDYAPYQEAAPRFPEISEAEFRESVQLVLPNGKSFSGAEAVFRSLWEARSHRWLLWGYRNIPGVRTLSEAAYSLVARNRPFFSRISRFFLGDESQRSEYRASVFLFPRLLGAVYFIAFASLAVQAPALFGPKGILPNVPEPLLDFVTWGGALSAVLVAAGIAQSALLALCWLLYLFLLGTGGPFMAFQWDTLLLEAGFIGIFLSLGRGSCFMRTFLKLLLFKLMFSSGLVKLASADPAWHNLTALKYHFETQPLPAWTSWYAHQLPSAALKLLCAGVFFCELVVPFLFFFPRRMRHFAAAVTIAFQAIILATGNFNFFNLLTIVLCIPLFDDASWPSRWNLPKPVPARRVLVRIAAVVLLLANLRMVPLLENFPLANSYGLFAVMTTERREIVVEGSDDNETWKAYEFRYKPGDLNRAPMFVEPHQPRLDWQMWFAALGTWRDNRWFLLFCRGLLEGSPKMTGLLKTNPFPEKAPHYVRALVYVYHFTNWDERKRTGAWWKRELKGLYCPVMSLKDSKAVAIS